MAHGALIAQCAFMAHHAFMAPCAVKAPFPLFCHQYVSLQCSFTTQLSATSIVIKLKLNPWHYSSEEPRLTEAVAARWQYRGALWLAKRLSLNLNFSFLNRISLLLMPSSYPIVLTRLGGPRSRPYTSRKISGI